MTVESIATGLPVADHKHAWAISAETFGSEDGGDFRLVECAICRVMPDRGVLPIPWSPEVADLLIEHVHRWLPAGIIHSGTMLVQSCECGVVRTVKVPG